MNRPRLIPLALAAACYLLALVQRPGDVVADTKLDLYVDPQGFLSEVASAWTQQVQLGHVFGGQYGGYLFPMAPWFALGDVLGMPTWLVHRLWLGTLLALAAWGAVRLMDALLDRARGAPHVAAALIFVLNPYVTVYANRTSISLLAYAALPWLLLAVHRGLREPKGWRWPALFALVLTCTGGGVNLAVTGWVLVGPLLFIVYERTLGGVSRGAILPFLLRLAPVAVLANVWWLMPALVHLGYGLDFLPFTEQPGTIWQTSSITESLRLMGFWTSYIGGGFGGELRPFSSHAPALLFHPAVLVASLLIPALTLGGFAWTRRWRYGPWFLILGLTGLAIMVTGFPEGTPLRKAFTFTYNQAEPLRFLRTTYKAGPLLALALAGLGGGLVGVAWDRARGSGAWRGALAAGTLVVCAVAAWPLTSGRAPERQLVFDVPSYWHDAADEVERMPAGRRAMVLPGRLFAYYDWGGTIDPILPAISTRPVAERMIVPFADLRAVDLQFATDALVSQERALPGQLAPLLRLMGVGSVVSNADDDRTRSGAIGPVEAHDVLARQAGLGEPRALGPAARERAAAGRVAPDRALPRVAVRDVARPGAMVSVLPRGPLTVVDGSADGIASMAAFGQLDARTPLAYAADLDAARIRRAAADGGEIVVTDSNRRQAFVAARMRASRGRVLLPTQSLSEDGAMLDPFDAGPDAQTVSRLLSAGPQVSELFAPFSPQTAQLPERRPAAALDGREDTMWLADRALSEDRHWMEVRFAKPFDVGTVEVLPYGDERGRPRVLEVGGRRVSVGRGWTKVAVNRRALRALRVAIVDATDPVGGTGGAGGIAELRIPGIDVRETLRPPVLAEKALAGQPVSGPLTYLFSRVTTDAPGRTGGAVGLPQTHLLRDRTDPEPELHRTFAPPVARRWTIDAWTRPRDTPGPALDRLAGTTGTLVADGPREGGLARHRASRAFDGDRRTAWIAPWVDRDGSGPAAPSATMTVELDRAATVRRLRLVPAPAAVRRATRVVVGARGGDDAQTVDVAADGTVALPRAIRAKQLTLRVVAARFPAGASGVERQRRAVGIAEIEGIPGARVRDAPPGATLRGQCGAAGVDVAGGPSAELRPVGTVAALEAGDPIRAVMCGDPVALEAGEHEVLPSAGGSLTIDHLRLRSTGDTTPAGAAGAPAGRVLDPGSEGNGARRGVRLQVDGPGWLVLGESFSTGWKATCDGRDLGAPVPLQGFANGWEVDRGCRDVDFVWAPNATLGPAYGVSLVTSLALLLLLALTARRPLLASGRRASFPAHDPPAPWPWRRALVAAAAAALAIGFVFAIRAGIAAFPLVVLVLRLAVPARTLALAGGALLAIVVPALYLLRPGPDPGGYNSNLAVDRIAAHWVGVAAVLLVVAALARTLAAARAARRVSD